MRRNTWLVWGAVAVIAVAAVVIAVAASGGGDGSSGTAHATKYEQAPVTVAGTNLATFGGNDASDKAVGTTIPTLTGVSVIDGAPVEIKPNGKPQVIVFLAHWCPHCQVEMPRIVSLAKQGELDGVAVTAVATDTSSNAPNYPPSAWLKRSGWPFPALADSSEYAAARAYGLTAFPFLVFVDAQGNVVKRASGEIAPADLKRMFAALAAGTSVPTPDEGASSSAS
jgi:thiol-disulfide isomerase/thioredoxin